MEITKYKTKAQECQLIAHRIRQKMLEVPSFYNDTIHWGGSFSSIEIFSVLYNCVLNCHNKNLDVTQKDKFLLSKGHASLGYYTTLLLTGLMSEEKWLTYRQDGGDLSELVEYNESLGFEMSGGSLGLGLSYGAGLALLAKKRNYDYKVYVEVGDGEMDEGSVWEAVMFASQNKLDNLIMVVDANKAQSDGETAGIISWKNLRLQLESFGWNTLSVDGHSCDELIDAFLNNNVVNKPKAIIANTVKGKGVSFMESDYSWHDKVLRGEELEIARKEVNLYVDN